LHELTFFSIFPVTKGYVSTTDTRSIPNGTAVLFGMARIPGSESSIFVADASFGSATLAISSGDVASVSASTKIAKQQATCWATVSDLTRTGFVTDVSTNDLVEVDLKTGALIKKTTFLNSNPGYIDLVAAGRYVYALSPGNGTTKSAVNVVDISGDRGSAKSIQNFSPAGGITSAAQGMAFF